jgi:hypothetical protein
LGPRPPGTVPSRVSQDRYKSAKLSALGCAHFINSSLLGMILNPVVHSSPDCPRLGELGLYGHSLAPSPAEVNHLPQPPELLSPFIAFLFLPFTTSSLLVEQSSLNSRLLSYRGLQGK